MNKKTEILKRSLTIVMLAVLIVVAITATQAWFEISNQVEVDSLELHASQTENIYISKNGEDWSHSLDFSDVVEDVEFEEVTSLDNGYTLSTPIRSGETGLPYEDSVWELAVANQEYVEIEFYIKSTRSIDLCMDYEETTILPNMGDDDKAVLIGADDDDVVINKSAYGNFSNNFIAGASRIGVLDTTEDEDTDGDEETFLKSFAPNPYYHLTTTPNDSGTNDFSFAIDEDDDDFETFTKIDSDTTSDTYNEEIEMLDTDINYPQNIIETNDDKKNNYLLTLDVDDSGDAIVRKIKIIVWIEGCDREAKEALDGGIIDINISLTGEIVVEDVSVDD